MPDSLTNPINMAQLQVTAARPGVVHFELDIRKEHTVRFPLPFASF